MNRFVRFLSVLLAFFAWLTNIKVPDGILLIPLTVFKIFASSFALIIAIFSATFTLFSLMKRDKKTFFFGMLGSILAVRHLRRATAVHQEFEFTFGPHWQAQIPHHLAWRLRKNRYTLQPLSSAAVPFVKDFVIGTHTETNDPLLADIWQPRNGTPHTGVGIIYLHGGGWHYFDKDFLGSTRPLFQHLAKQGYLIADLAYTLSPKATLIPMVADVKRAIAWMKTNADNLQINPDKIVLMGNSAGAHLALVAAYTPNHPFLDPSDIDGVDTAVCGVISYYGVSDMVRLHENLSRFSHEPASIPTFITNLLQKIRFLPEYGSYIQIKQLVQGVMHGTPEEEYALYQLGSPITHVGKHCPPTLLLNGTHDAGPDLEQHRQLHTALYRHGVPSVHVEYDSADHLFDLIGPTVSPAGQAALYDLERFLSLLI